MAWNSLPGFIRDPTSSTNVLGVYLKRTCSRVTSASSALGVLNDYALYKSTHSLTHSLTHSGVEGSGGFNSNLGHSRASSPNFKSAESGDGALGTACYRAWGPRFYEPPEPPVSTLLITITAIITTWTKTIHGVLDISSVTSGKLTQSNELWRRIEQLVTRSQRQVSAFHLLS